VGQGFHAISSQAFRELTAAIQAKSLARYWMSPPLKPPLWVDQESLDSADDEIIELTINLVVLLTEAQKREIA